MFVAPFSLDQNDRFAAVTPVLANRARGGGRGGV